MQATFLIGPAGSGKTYRCLQEIRAALKAAPEGLPLIFLAPKQATFQLERELLADPDIPGFRRLNILSFDLLAEFVLFGAAGGMPRLLNDEGRIMVLRALLEQQHAELKLFHATARLPGFAQHLSQLLRELQEHQLSPERLLETAGQPLPVPQLKDKLHDIALLLRTYLAWLKDNELEDPNSLLDLAAEAVRAAIGRKQFRLGGLWLDGFGEITPQELNFLAALVPGCEQATLAFCLDRQPASESAWFSMWSGTSKTFRRCHQRLAALPGCAVSVVPLRRGPGEHRFSRNPVLNHLEQCWVEPRAFDSGELPISAGAIKSSLQLFACPNPEVEAVVAAREILQYVREQGGRFRDVAVLVRSLEGYHHVLSRVFARYQIPCFIDRREPIAHHPLAELTRYAVRTVVSFWEHDDWFGALKTGLVHRDEATIDGLENEALARGWRGHVWLNPLTLPREPELAARLEALRQIIVPPFSRLAETLSAVHRRPTGVELAAAIRALWQELRVFDTLEQWSDAAAAARTDARDSILQSEIHLAAWQELNQWLDNLELAFEKTPLPLGDWIPVLEAGLATLSVGVIPPALDQVLIGAVDRSRNPNLQMVLVLGLNETVFPAVPAASVLLTEHDRETLAAAGLELGLNQRQQIGLERFLGYIACTRAQRRVVLTYALRDFNDVPLNPSPFIDHLQRLFPGWEADPAPALPDWRDSLHANELIVPLLRNRLHHPGGRVQSLARLEALPWFQPVLARWIQIVTARQVTRLSPGLAKKLYGPKLETSISALEDYAACPFKFFVVRGLRAEERQEFEADPRERGSFQHEVLMEFHRRLQAGGKRWRDLSPAEARAFIGRVGEDVQQTFRHGLFASTPERRFTARMLIQGLQKVIAVLVGWAPQYAFEPQAVELSFGMEEHGLQAWRIDLGYGRELLLRGRIDRVDLYRGGSDEAHVTVIDYKSSGQELEAVKLLHGLDLQLLAYLGVLRDAPNAGEIFGVAKLVPAGAFYVSLRSAGGSGPTREDVLAEQEEALKAGFQHRGRFRGDKLDWFDNRGAVKGDQFRYAFKKDGDFKKQGNEAMPAEEFLALVTKIEEFLRGYGQEIFEGNVRVAPYRHKAEKACDHCDYRTVCRFDPWIEPYKVLKLKS